MYTIKYFIRILLKNKVFSAITIGGFSVSLAVVIILIAFIISELSFDKNISGLNEIYRVVSLSDNDARIPEEAKSLLETNYPQVKHATNVMIAGDPVVYNNKNYQVRSILTDESFFDVFSIEFIHGYKQGIFEDKYNVALTESCANKIFGEEDPIGKVINVGHQEDLKVTAIVKDFSPQNSLYGDILYNRELKIHYSGGNYNGVRYCVYNLYLKTEEGANISSLNETLTTDMKQFIPWEGEFKYGFQKYSEVYFDTMKRWDNLRHANVKLITLLSWLTFIILALAVFNYVNLSVAQSTKRLNELGVKQVFGAGRKTFFSQFIYEALLQVAISLALALTLSVLVKPMFTEILGKEIVLAHIAYSPVGILLISSILIIVIIISGVYPAFYALRVQPKQLLQKQFVNTKDTFNLQWVLNVLQFATTIILIITLLTINRQIDYVKNKDMGYSTELLLQIPVHWKIKENISVLKEEISKASQVKNICASHGIPGSIRNSSSNNEIGQVSVITSREDFVTTFDFPVINGRNFFKGEKNRVCLINQTLAQKTGGWEKVAHTEMFGSEVVGVISDFHFKNLYNNIENLQVVNGNDASHLTLRLHPGNISDAIKAIEEQYKKVAPDYAFSFHFYDEWLDSMYKQEEKQAASIRLLSIIAILLTCLGLVGKIEFSSKRRTKEIGIRKVNGAKVSEILTMLNKDFIKWVAIAFVIACPIAYYAMSKWLENFAYKTTLSWWIFALAGALALGIALVTVSFQSWKAATRNPIESLRYE